jgi:hypothetical protein
MVSDMVERVAVAISGAPYPTANSVRKAIAALKALREPTPEMVDEGNRTAGREAQWHCSVEEIWSAMLSAAIGEG